MSSTVATLLVIVASLAMVLGWTAYVRAVEVVPPMMFLVGYAWLGKQLTMRQGIAGLLVLVTG